jgi:hypothetical protein
MEARNQGSTSWSHRPIPRTIAANAHIRGGSRMRAHRSFKRRCPCDRSVLPAEKTRLRQLGWSPRGHILTVGP